MSSTKPLIWSRPHLHLITFRTLAGRALRRARVPSFKIRQLTDVFHCKLQHHFSCKRYRALSKSPALARELRCSVASALPDQLEPAS